MTISSAGVQLCVFVNPDTVPTVRNGSPSTIELWPSKSIWNPTFGPETLKWLWLIGGNSLKCWKQQLVAARLLIQNLRRDTCHAGETLAQVNKVLRSSRVREKICLYSKYCWIVLCHRMQFVWLWISYFMAVPQGWCLAAPLRWDEDSMRVEHCTHMSMQQCLKNRVNPLPVSLLMPVYG